MNSKVAGLDAPSWSIDWTSGASWAYFVLMTLGVAVAATTAHLTMIFAAESVLDILTAIGAADLLESLPASYLTVGLPQLALVAAFVIAAVLGLNFLARSVGRPAYFKSNNGITSETDKIGLPLVLSWQMLTTVIFLFIIGIIGSFGQVNLLKSNDNYANPSLFLIPVTMFLHSHALNLRIWSPKFAANQKPRKRPTNLFVAYGPVAAVWMMIVTILFIWAVIAFR